MPTYDTLKTNSAKRTATANAEAIARNANAISASDGSGGVTVQADITAAGGEATAGDTATGTSGWLSGTSEYFVTSGSIECYISVDLSSDQAVVTDSDCAAEA